MSESSLSLKEGLHQATSEALDMGLLTVCVCTNANLGTPSIIQQIMSFAVLIFFPIFSLPKIALCMFKKTVEVC